MKRIEFILGVIILILSNQSFAGWTNYLNIDRVEIHGTGVFLVTKISGLTEPGCIASQIYSYAQFVSSNEKLADRALSSVYYAKASNKKIKVVISGCAGSYAIATGVWLE